MENKKHILFISSWYPNRQDPTHGIFNRQFAEAASVQNKISVLHVCSDKNISSDFEIIETSENGIETLIVYYKKIKSRLPFISQLKKRRQLIKAFDLGYKKLTAKVGTPDLIQLNVVLPAGVGVYYLSEKYNIPFVINEGWTGYTPEDGNYKGFAQKFYTRKIVAKAKAIMPVSEHLKKAMLSHHLDGNYFIVPNVVDINLFVPKDSPAGNEIKYLHISSLDDAQKNVSGIIRAFHEAQKIIPGIELNIIGDGNDKVMLQNLVTELKLGSKVNFKGYLFGVDLVNEINANQVLIMFSNYETFCLAVVESLACGKPVITSRAGGVTSQITPELGISLNSKDEKALSDALINFAGNLKKYDTKLIRQFVIENFSKEIISSKLNEVYNFALSGNN